MALVHMKHPDIETTGTATEEAFELIYEAKGWKKINAEDANIPASISQVPDYSTERTDEEKALSEELVAQQKRTAKPKSSAGGSSASTSKEG